MIHDLRRESVLAALQLSAQKWGTFQVFGSDQYKRLCVDLAIEHGFRITNPELQQTISDERDARRMVPDRAVRTPPPPREPVRDIGEAYRRHLEDVREVPRHRDADASRLDAAVAVRLDAQVLRTPRGLARIQRMSGFDDRNACLLAMQQIRQIHGTMWVECVWEIIDCTGSGVDLLVSDNPVTFYNRALVPGARECAFPLEPDLALLGTQTLFPLCKDKLLVLTNLQFARDPSYNPKKTRINPRYFAPTVFSMLDVITDSRKLDAEGVLKVNYIMKSRAHQYIASSTEDGLYPERQLPTTHWSKLCQDEFLLPDPREITFATATIFGYDDGRPGWGMDEYGRPPRNNEMEDQNRAREFAALDRRKKQWERRWGPLGRVPAHFRHSRPRSNPKR